MKYTVVICYNLLMSWVKHGQLPSHLSSYLGLKKGIVPIGISPINFTFAQGTYLG